MTAKPKRDIFDKITLAVAIAGVIVITWQSVETDRAEMKLNTRLTLQVVS